MKFTNNHGLPAPLANALAGDSYSMGDADISVTGIMSSPKIRILSQKLDAALEVDVMDRIWSVFGTAIHNILEAGATHEEGYLAEERITSEFNGWRVSGGIDVQHSKGGSLKIIDWKTTSAWAVVNEKPEWAEQLNIYRVLVERERGIKVDKLQIGAIIRDWSRRESTLKPDTYPQTPIVMIDIPLWPIEKAEAYINERVKIHQDAQRAFEWGEPLPDCTPAEMWERESKWAVKKPGLKRAHKVFDNERDAVQLAEEINGIVEHRPGERIRCDSYCAVSRWCSQYQDYKEMRDEAEPSASGF